MQPSLFLATALLLATGSTSAASNGRRRALQYRNGAVKRYSEDPNESIQARAVSLAARKAAATPAPKKPSPKKPSPEPAPKKHGKVCMFSTIHKNLKQGGVFVGVCMHPVENVWSFIAHHNSKVWAMTGLEDMYQDRLPGDAGFVYKAVFHPHKAVKFGQTIKFEAYHLNKSLYEAAARLAGLQGKLEWQHCDCPDNLPGQLGLEFDAVSW
ncbi:unnamed protein product [Clonostachys rhizophaga]|uniref:Uncharacterized protein n=1 Tax=Clonostachys rhizophaga TaxID=160324 RepID=A0A9N9VCH7_9HYPO|nr:unnamed protein product [Clonostachys rhizophaga]